jgi:hypothetical protein
MQTTTPKSLVMKKRLVKDPKGHLEAVGRHDLGSMEQVLENDVGKGTVLRLMFGSSTEIPVRALSYLLSAARAAQMLPVEQVQIVSVSHLGEQINKIPKSASEEEFRKFAAVGQRMLSAVAPEAATKTLFCFDSPTSHDDHLVPLVRSVMEKDVALRASLFDRGTKHGGDFVTYTAAHIEHQDMSSHVPRPFAGAGDLVTPERIVSVGSQQEKLFYAARVGVRAAMDPRLIIPSVQIFTKHISAPYFMSNGGEQLIGDSFARGMLETRSANGATDRDLSHLASTLETHELGIHLNPHQMQLHGALLGV